ncbi:MAG: YceI family protein [Myxococcota bacterium]
MTPALHIYVYREGLLARFGHDLRLTVPRFEVTLRGDRVTAWFDVGSVRVDGAATGEKVDPTRLSEADKTKIQAAIAGEILDVARFPKVTLEGDVTFPGPAVRARLTMKGRTADEEIPVSRVPGLLRVNTVITPSRWGITPYKTLAGAIRLQDRWRIQLYLPWDPPLDALRGADKTWVGVG